MFTMMQPGRNQKARVWIDAFYCAILDRLVRVAPDAKMSIATTRAKCKPLQQTILGGQSVQRVVGFTVGTDGARESIGDVAARQATVGVNVSNVDLHGSVVLGANQAASGRATRVSAYLDGAGTSKKQQTARPGRNRRQPNAAGRVKGTYHLRGMYKSTISPLSFCILLSRLCERE
jgi:hypothetical protein